MRLSRLAHLADFGDVATLPVDPMRIVGPVAPPYGKPDWFQAVAAAGGCSAADAHDSYATALGVQGHVAGLDPTAPGAAGVVASWNSLVPQLIAAYQLLATNTGYDVPFGYSSQRKEVLGAAATQICDLQNQLADLDWTIQSVQQAVAAQATLVATQVQAQTTVAQAQSTAAQVQLTAAQQQLAALQAPPTPWGTYALIGGAVAVVGGALLYRHHKRASPVSGYRKKRGRR